MRLAWVVFVLLAASAAAGAQGATLERLWEASVPDAVQAAPIAADIRGSGQPSIVIVSKGRGMLCEFDSAGSLLATLRFPSEMSGGAAAADLDGDGRAELIAADGAGNLKAWSPGRRVLWQARLESGVGRGGPLMVDLSGDPRPEIVVGTDEGVVWCFDARGRVLWKHEAPEGWWPQWGLIAAPIVAANVDGAGRPEVILASREGVICCLNADGRRRWTARVGTYCRIEPVTADFDDDGRLEVMVSCYSPHQALPGGKAYLHCLDAATGAERWRADVGGETLGPALPLSTRAGTKPMVVSYDGRVGVLTGPQVKWVWGDPKQRRNQAVAPGALLDFDGDGQTDIALVTDSRELVVVDADGAELARVGTRAVPEAPCVIADLNRDGRLEILVVGSGGQTECWALPASARLAPKPRPRLQQMERRPQTIEPHVLHLTGVTLRPLWWNRQTASPAVVFANRTATGRHLEYDLSLQHPDGRVASKAGVLYVPARGNAAVTMPYIELTRGHYLLRCAMREGGGRLVITATHYAPMPVAPRPPARRPATTARRDPSLPSTWRMPVLQGRDFWHVVRYEPELWQKFGLAAEPFIQQAVPRVWSPPNVFARDFALDSPVRRALLADTKPIMLMNQYFGPQAPVDASLYRAFERDFGDRFVGFQSHEYGYGAVTGWTNDGTSPWTRAEGARRLAEVLRRQLSLTYGKLYAGEGYRLPYHLAFREGVTAGYIEVGENIPATPLQVAVLRGAARQYGRPWGYYISAWFRNSVTTYDTARSERVFSDGSIYSGPDAGHSVSLMERMLYLGYLSGATFVHHESDTFASSIWVEDFGKRERTSDPPGHLYPMSPMGLATKRWFDFTRRHPNRGVAYAPFAVMVDANHGWCPEEDQAWRALPPTEGERAMSKIVNLFYPWQFSTVGERGFLAHGRFGDTVDFVSHEASPDILAAYRVIMLLGDVPMDKQVASRLRRFVESGGAVLVSAGQKPSLLGPEVSRVFDGGGRRFANRPYYASGVRGAADGKVLATAPYAYWPLRKGVGRAWWMTGDGRPLVAEIGLGKGRVVVMGATHGLDLTGKPLPVLQTVIARLYDGLLPVRVQGDIEYTLARNADGWVVGLINSKGVWKTPVEAARTVGAGAQVDITAPWRAAAAEEWTADAKLANLAGKGTRVSLTVPPGQVRVVFLERR